MLAQADINSFIIAYFSKKCYMYLEPNILPHPFNCKLEIYQPMYIQINFFYFSPPKGLDADYLGHKERHPAKGVSTLLLL